MISYKHLLNNEVGLKDLLHAIAMILFSCGALLRGSTCWFSYVGWRFRPLVVAAGGGVGGG